MDHRIADLLDRQDGVISRRQAVAAGMTVVEVKRRIRRREWSQIHPGVYVHHTGPPSWRQRAWAAVLACWPAALDGVSALRAFEGPGRRGPSDDHTIHVVVHHRRTVRPPPGVTLRRCRRFDEVVLSNLGPPRVRYEDAVIAVADAAGDVLTAVGTLSEACGGRRTTAARLRRSLDRTPRLRRRRLLDQILADVEGGVCSVLEHAYLTMVERPHGLPPGVRQVAVTGSGGRRMFRDVVHGQQRPRWRLVVELDGRLFHSSAEARDRDLDRDLDAAVERVETVRLGYGQVLERGCRTAARIARVMQRLGWEGVPVTCPRCPSSGERVDAGRPA